MATNSSRLLVLQDHLDYLDKLRASGVTNMFGADAFLAQKFHLDRKTAKEITKHWMQLRQQAEPDPMEMAEDVCKVCGAHVGYGIRALHLGRCDDHAEAE